MLADFDRAGRRAFDRAQPARLTSLRGKGGALGTADAHGFCSGDLRWAGRLTKLYVDIANLT